MAKFNPADHPRGSNGRFVTKGSGAAAVVATLGLAFTLNVGGVRAAIQPATPIRQSFKIESKVDAEGVTSAVRVNLRVLRVIMGARDHGKRRIRLSVDITNKSNVAIRMLGSEQEVGTDQGNEYKGQSIAKIDLKAGKSVNAELVFLIPDDERPTTLTVAVAGKHHKVSLASE